MSFLKKVGILIALIACGFQDALAQKRVSDSLVLLLEKERDPALRVDIYNSLAYSLYDFDDTLAFSYSNIALMEAQKIGYRKGEKEAFVMMGLGHFGRGDFFNALEFYKKAIDSKAAGTEKTTAYVFQMVGKLNFELANYDSALFYYTKAMKVPGVENDLATVSNIYRNIAQVLLVRWKNDEALDYLKKSEELLIQAGKPDSYLLTEIWSLMGVYYENKLDFASSGIYYDKMCALANRDQDYFHLIKCKLNQADLAYRLSNYSKSIEYLAEALQLSESYNYPPQQAEVYARFGDVYSQLSQHDLATKYFYEALKITEKLGLRHLTARTYSDLAWVFHERKDFNQALSYIDRSQQIREAIGDPRGIGNCMNVKGLISLEQKKMSEALNYFEQAAVAWSAIDHQEGIAAISFNMSLVFIKQGLYQKAMDHQLEAIQVELRINNKKSLGISYNQLAELLIQMGRLNEAGNYLKIAKQMARETGSLLQIRSNNQVYAQWYEARGDFKNAYRAQKEFSELNDSIYVETGALKLAEMEALYRVEQKEQKIRLLNQEAQLKESEMARQQSELNTQRSITAGALMGLVLISILAFTIFRYSRNIKRAHRDMSEQKEEIQAQAEELTESNEMLIKLHREVVEKSEEIEAQSEELIEANQTISEINRGLETKIETRTTDLKQAYKELDTFFYRSSHDFRRPLTTFMGLAEVAKITVKERNALELFEKVNETAHTLDRMLVKLQSISDIGAQQLIFKEVFLLELFETIIDTFRSELDEKGIKVSLNIQRTLSLISYPALVKIIAENLIENAIVFSNVENPFLNIEVSKVNDGVLIKISDNGEGIPVHLHDRIFEMYFRGSERSKGNGLGLYITRKAIEKLHGQVKFASEAFKGTVFEINLPDFSPQSIPS
jgi:signal transduction histidine kinase